LSTSPEKKKQKENIEVIVIDDEDAKPPASATTLSKKKRKSSQPTVVVFPKNNESSQQASNEETKKASIPTAPAAAAAEIQKNIEDADASRKAGPPVSSSKKKKMEARLVSGATSVGEQHLSAKKKKTDVENDVAAGDKAGSSQTAVTATVAMKSSTEVSRVVDEKKTVPVSEGQKEAAQAAQEQEPKKGTDLVAPEKLR
jgi:hypothetical protein